MTTADATEAEGHLSTFRLVFEGVTCDDCGETKPVTRTCKCGAWTPRLDEHVVHRRAVVADIQARLTAPDVATTPIEIVEALDVLVPWIGAFFDGMNRLGENVVDAAAVDEQVQALVDLRARVAAIPRRRPWLAMWDPFKRVLEALTSLAETYLETATAPDPQSAQALEAVGQQHLDAAAIQIKLLNARVDFWGLNRTIRLPDSLVGAATAAYEATGARDLLDLDRRGMLGYERISGRATGPIGVGVGLLLDLGLVDRALDDARVFRVARSIYERVDKHRAGFLSLLDDQAWRADLLNARRLFYEAQLTAETLLRGLAGERRLEAEAVIRLGARLTERVSAAIVGLVVAADRTSRLKRTADYTVVLAAARTAGLADSLLGFDDRVRNADAHSDYDVGEDHVVLGRNRSHPELVGDEELADIVLSAIESCAAIFAGIDCVLLEEGHPAATDRVADLKLNDLLTILLGACGVQTTKLEFRADRLKISGSAFGAAVAVNPLTVIAALSPYLPEATKRATFRLKRNGGHVVADVILDALRRFQASTGVAREASFIEYMGRATLNGRPVLPSRHVRFLAAYNTVPLLEATLEQLQDGVRHLAGAARRLNDRELAAALEAAVVIKRAKEGGPPAPAALGPVYNRLVEYLRQPPGPWNDGSGSGRLAAA